MCALTRLHSHFGEKQMSNLILTLENTRVLLTAVIDQNLG